MSDLQKITTEQMDAVGVVSAPDVLNGTTVENKGVFDKMARELIVPEHNKVVEKVNGLKKSVQTGSWRSARTEVSGRQPAPAVTSL